MKKGTVLRSRNYKHHRDFSLCGMRMREKRGLSRLTQDQLSEILEVDQATIASWESERNETSQDCIVKLAIILNTNPYYLNNMSDDDTSMLNMMGSFNLETQKKIVEIISRRAEYSRPYRSSVKESNQCGQKQDKIVTDDANEGQAYHCGKSYAATHNPDDFEAAARSSELPNGLIVAENRNSY